MNFNIESQKQKVKKSLLYVVISQVILAWSHCPCLFSFICVQSLRTNSELIGSTIHPYVTHLRCLCLLTFRSSFQPYIGSCQLLRTLLFIFTMALNCQTSIGIEHLISQTYIAPLLPCCCMVTHLCCNYMSHAPLIFSHHWHRNVRDSNP